MKAKETSTFGIFKNIMAGGFARRIQFMGKLTTSLHTLEDILRSILGMDRTGILSLEEFLFIGLGTRGSRFKLLLATGGQASAR